MGRDRQKALLWSAYTFHRYHWFAVNGKSFPVGCAQESRNSADKNLYSILVRHCRIFLNVRIRYTHIHALFRIIVQIRCIHV